MDQPRNSDQAGLPHDTGQRNIRSYEINGQWYFELRGGGQKGPYASEQEMQADLNEFIQLHKHMNQQNP